MSSLVHHQPRLGQVAAVGPRLLDRRRHRRQRLVAPHRVDAEDSGRRLVALPYPAVQTTEVTVFLQRVH